MDEQGVRVVASETIPSVDRPLKTFVPNLVSAAAGTAVESVLVDGEFCRADRESVTRRATERARETFAAAADSTLVEDVENGYL